MGHFRRLPLLLLLLLLLLMVSYVLDLLRRATHNMWGATPSSASLETILLLGILPGYQTISLSISTALINTPQLDTEEIYVEPPQEW